MSATLDERVRDFIVRTFIIDGREAKLGAETPLIESGVVDSMGVVEIVEFLEAEFGIEVEDEEIMPDNMDSIARLVRFVEGKQGVSQAAQTA